MKPLLKIQEEKRVQAEEQGQQKPQLTIDQFSFEELHTILKSNGGQILGVYDELEGFWQQLDVYKALGM